VTVKAILTDGDNDYDTQTANIGAMLNFEDDGPGTVTPDYAYMVNKVSSPEQSMSDIPLDIDINIDDNMGADRDGGTIKFNYANGDPSNLTSGSSDIFFYVSSDGQTLVGSTTAPLGGLDADSASVLANKVFTAVLNPDGDLGTSDDTYSFTLHQQIDGGLGSFNVNDSGYVFHGGNSAYSYFDDTIADNLGDQDILITPMEGGSSGGKINESNNFIGVSEGQSIGFDEAVRVDFVNGLAGSPPNADYSVAANQNHTFSGHNIVNGASLTIGQTEGTDILIKAFDDTDSNNSVGDGISDNITKVQISYGGETLMVEITATPQTVTIGGHEFTVTENGNDVLVEDVIGGNPGSPPDEYTQIEIFTDDGFTSAEYHYMAGDTFKIGGFGASTFNPGSEVELKLDLITTDADGDSVVMDEAIHIELSPDDHHMHFGTDGDDAGVNALIADPLHSAETLVGLDGNDELVGGDGNDILWGNQGNDTMTGGAGADTFKITEGEDTITDYNQSDGDVVDISHVLDSDLGDYLAVSENLDGTAKLSIYDSGDIEKASVSFDNINYDTDLTPGDELNSLLGQVDVDDGSDV
jgi:hypothetical protein